MLVLRRSQGEGIHIGSEITVHIKRIHQNKVEIGVEAPEAIRISRTELGKPIPKWMADTPTDRLIQEARNEFEQSGNLLLLHLAQRIEDFLYTREDE